MSKELQRRSQKPQMTRPETDSSLHIISRALLWIDLHTYTFSYLSYSNILSLIISMPPNATSVAPAIPSVVLSLIIHITT